MSHLTIDTTGLSQRHIDALKMFIEKFIAGAKEHGDLSAGKDWTLDSLQETCDLAFYLLFSILDRKK